MIRAVAQVSQRRREQFKAEKREAIDKIKKGRDFEIEKAGEKSESLATKEIIKELEKRKKEADEAIQVQERARRMKWVLAKEQQAKE